MNSENEWTAVSNRAQQILKQKFSRVERFSNDGRRNLLLRCTPANSATENQTSVVIKQMLPYYEDPAVSLFDNLQILWPETVIFPLYPAFQQES